VNRAPERSVSGEQQKNRQGLLRALYIYPVLHYPVQALHIYSWNLQGRFHIYPVLTHLIGYPSLGPSGFGLSTKLHQLPTTLVQHFAGLSQKHPSGLSFWQSRCSFVYPSPHLREPRTGTTTVANKLILTLS